MDSSRRLDTLGQPATRLDFPITSHLQHWITVIARSAYTHEKFLREKRKAEKKKQRLEKRAARQSGASGSEGAPVIHPVDTGDDEDSDDAAAPPADGDAPDRPSAGA